LFVEAVKAIALQDHQFEIPEGLLLQVLGSEERALLFPPLAVVSASRKCP
jgi:hypothetical protein